MSNILVQRFSASRLTSHWVFVMICFSCLVPGVQTRCSLAPAVDILAYSEREWKGNTAKSSLIRKVTQLTLSYFLLKCIQSILIDLSVLVREVWLASVCLSQGYSEMSQSFSGLRRVRGDNYCALRATLYQVLANSTNMPIWLQDEGFLLVRRPLYSY